jgi:two-component system cell cycle sensor histidine kinase/response regulator CckA
VDDVTELELAEQELMQSQKMEAIGMLAGGVAHDFNNILLGVTATVSLLKLALDSGVAAEAAELAGHVGMIEKSAARAKDIVTRLLTIVRKQMLPPVPSDLVKIVRDSVEMCSTSFDRRVEISASFAVQEAPLMAEPVQLEQAILNVAINSLHAMTVMRGEGQPQGGILSIAVGRAHADGRFVASHAGAREGVDYWTVEMTDTGVGTIVTIFLPVMEGKTLRESASEREKPQRGEGTVMVVDDEGLARCGYGEIYASNGLEAMELLNRNRGKVNAVLLDVNMPALSGYEAFDGLQAADPDAAILVSSGFIRDERVDLLIQKGAKDFIQKPFTIHALARAIHCATTSRRHPQRPDQQ